MWRVPPSAPPPWLIFLMSLSGSQGWWPFTHLGSLSENTHAWSHVKPIKSESLGSGVQMLVYFRSFPGILMSTGCKKAQSSVDYETLCNYPVNLCLARLNHFTSL